MKILINEKVRKCAFCKYWYDPTNSALEPTFGKGMWRIDTDMKNKCRLKNISKMPAGNFCNNFESKL